jgi:Tfp pilus assembly protein PilE
MIRTALHSWRRLRSDDHGFTLVAVMAAMLVLGTFSAAAWAAANGDIPLARSDQDRKSAYEAAEAGVQWYTHQLELSTNYWATCTPTAQGVNMQGSRTSWRTVGAASEEQFAIEVMRAPGKACDPNKYDSTILNNGSLQIRVTGKFRKVQRQEVVTFRRDGFLDFVWYTKRETSPPASYNGSDTAPSWVADHCDTVRAARTNSNNGGESCSIIDFQAGDNIKGPMHTEDDSFSYSGPAIFGRDTDDKIEVSGQGATPEKAYSNHSASGSIVTKGTLIAPGRTVDPPEDNSVLKNFADVKLYGDSCIRLNGTTMTVWDKQTGWGGASAPVTCAGAGTDYPLTGDTVVWVDNNTTCTTGYQKYQKYPTDTCGNVAVWGTYSQSLTIGSANDIIVKGDVTRVSGSDALLGLVANQFVRVYHPVKFNGASTCNYQTDNLFATPPVKEIDAAILATRGSFIDDNWFCGDPEQNLTVKGTIAQYWRGAIGGTTVDQGRTYLTGYIKQYQYDDRLKYREPPQFLAPANSQWHVLRQTEQVPVRSN